MATEWNGRCTSVSSDCAVKYCTQRWNADNFVISINSSPPLSTAFVSQKNACKSIWYTNDWLHDTSWAPVAFVIVGSVLSTVYRFMDCTNILIRHWYFDGKNWSLAAPSHYLKQWRIIIGDTHLMSISQDIPLPSITENDLRLLIYNRFQISEEPMSW